MYAKPLQVNQTVNLSIEYEAYYARKYPGFANYAQTLGPENWEVRRVFPSGRATLRKNGITLEVVPRQLIIAK